MGREIGGKGVVLVESDSGEGMKRGEDRSEILSKAKWHRWTEEVAEQSKELSRNRIRESEIRDEGNPKRE